jgi:hypothetical protein
VELAVEIDDWERAISVLLLLRQIQPSDVTLKARLVEAYVHQGQRLLAAGQYDRAGAEFYAALTLQPDNQEALAGMTRLMALTPTPTATVTGTATPTPTPTPIPTLTPSVPPTQRPTAAPTLTPTPTPTPMPYTAVHLSFGPNTRYPNLGCSWFGFTGRVVDAYGYPIQGITVRISGTNWEGVQTSTSVSGDYEQFLNNSPRQGKWFVQLLRDGTAISDVVTVDTEANCDKAVIQVDWRRVY